MRVDGQRHAPATLPPAKRPGTRCVGGWVGSRAGLDGCNNSNNNNNNSGLSNYKR
jgi:hypothetical protein